jgi:hypothetical protein
MHTIIVTTTILTNKKNTFEVQIYKTIQNEVSIHAHPKKPHKN